MDVSELTSTPVGFITPNLTSVLLNDDMPSVRAMSYKRNYPRVSLELNLTGSRPLWYRKFQDQPFLLKLRVDLTPIIRALAPYFIAKMTTHQVF